MGTRFAGDPGIPRPRRRTVGTMALLAVTLGTLIGLLPAARADAQAAVVTTTSTISVTGQTLFVPCALGGAGETVVLDGNVHALFHITFDGQGGAHMESQSNYQGVIGIGLQSGAIYQVTGGQGSSVSMNGGLPFTSTFIDSIQLIGRGQAVNQQAHLTFHLTISATGSVTADLFFVRGSCA